MRRVKARARPEPVFPATILLDLKDRDADTEPLNDLPWKLRDWGLVLIKPLAFRRLPEDPRRIEITCTFPGRVEARGWLRHPLVRKYYGKDLRALLRRRPRVLRRRSPHEDEDLRTCRCRRPRNLLLATACLFTDSPLRCGECRGRLPPARVRSEAISNWADVFRHVDAIWLESGLLERWADRQQRNPRSPLNLAGRRAAREAERVFKTPVFYEVERVRRPRKGRCPLCRRPTSRAPWRDHMETCRRCRVAF